MDRAPVDVDPRRPQGPGGAQELDLTAGAIGGVRERPDDRPVRDEGGVPACQSAQGAPWPELKQGIAAREQRA
ncbi:hypothetical protein KCV87_05490 [Actinosynnema pretiosum subsp. pretiosum]|uniref:Uncharacterized protein n=1 Tax=Actinosynnema pretiosum subsp. pretiosum TaxID=103721 RepID=A0AA45R536_9PSEU|nr:hypothetical protein KCV87_05490 [Actinosynnema pretiosum subsp. pretiosum]